MLRYSRVPNTTGVLNKSEGGNFFEICLVKKRDCRSDFLAYLLKKSLVGNNFPKRMRLTPFLFGTLQYVEKKSIKKCC